MFDHAGYPLPIAVALAILPLVVLVAAGRAGRRWPFERGAAVRVLDHPLAPAVAGLIALGVTWWAWGGASEPGAIHDERAYLLQARIFATGSWSAPSPPLPEFWEQMHVFVRPATAAKYPPLHAAVLAPGIALGHAGIVPLLLTGLTAALVYGLARRLADPWVAALTWLLWTTSTTALVWRGSYLSQVTSTFLWVASLSLLVRWRSSRRAAWLLGVALLLSAMALARPLTAIALALPIGVVLLADCLRDRRWALLGGAAAVCMAVAAVVPLWGERTLGDWSENPYSAYSRVYFPFDTVGFGATSTASPPAGLPSALERLGEEFRELHDRHRPSRLPLILLQRLGALVVDVGQGWRLGLMVLLVAGLAHAKGLVRFGAISTASLVLAYLAFAHPPLWTVYYLEVFPFLWFVVALEVGRVLRRVAGSDEGAAAAACVTAVAFAALSVGDVARARERQDALRGFHRDAGRRLAALPLPAVVFVRDSPRHNHTFGLVENHPDVTSVPLWVVHDRGDDNHRLLAAAPGRRAFVFDLGAGRLEPWPVPSHLWGRSSTTHRSSR